MDYIDSYSGIFGRHYYKNGQYAGSSYDGAIPQSEHFYSATGEYIGTSYDYGVFGKRMHTNMGRGSEIIRYPGITCDENIFVDDVYVGSSYSSGIGSVASVFGEDSF